jgi:hypothetical protein
MNARDHQINALAGAKGFQAPMPEPQIPPISQIGADQTRMGPPKAASGLAGSDPGGACIASEKARVRRPRDTAHAAEADASLHFFVVFLSSW